MRTFFPWRNESKWAHNNSVAHISFLNSYYYWVNLNELFTLSIMKYDKEWSYEMVQIKKESVPPKKNIYIQNLVQW